MTDICTPYLHHLTDVLATTSYPKYIPRYKSSVSETRGECDVTTKKCTEHRKFIRVPNTKGQFQQPVFLSDLKNFLLHYFSSYIDGLKVCSRDTITAGIKAHPEKTMVSELVKTYDCSTTSNLTYSTKFCVDYIMKNMKYKVCYSYFSLIRSL